MKKRFIIISTITIIMVISICLLNNKTVNKNSLKEKGTIYALYLDGIPIKQFPDKKDYKVLLINF